MVLNSMQDKPDRTARLSRDLEIFPLEPAGRAAVWTLLGIALLLDGLAIAMLIGGGIIVAGTVVAMLLIISVSSLFFWLAIAQRDSRIILDGRDLQLKVPLYGRRIPLASINSGQVRTINNLQVSPYQLKWRRNGLGIPGFNLGWFSSHGKGRILASATTPRVLAIPTRDNYTLLVSVTDSDGLTRRLRELTAGINRGGRVIDRV